MYLVTVRPAHVAQINSLYTCTHKHTNTHQLTVNVTKASVPILSSKEFSEKSIGDTNRGNAWQWWTFSKLSRGRGKALTPLKCKVKGSVASLPGSFVNSPTEPQVSHRCATWVRFSDTLDSLQSSLRSGLSPFQLEYQPCGAKPFHQTLHTYAHLQTHILENWRSREYTESGRRQGWHLLN